MVSLNIAWKFRFPNTNYKYSAKFHEKKPEKLLFLGKSLNFGNT